MSTRVRDVMSPDPITIDHGLSVLDAQRRMHQSGIRHLVVTGPGGVAGLISDRDIGVISLISGVNLEKTTVSIAATQNPYLVAPDDPLKPVVQKMVEDKIGSAIVMDQGKLVGLVTTIDVMAKLFELL